jgi:hypothetical protein
MTFWELINSNFFLLLLGFLFTTIAGAVLSNKLQRASWDRQTRLDLFKKRYEEGIQFLDSLSSLIGRRFFALQRLLWAMKHPDKYDLPETGRNYFEIVCEWNTHLRANRNKVRLLIGHEEANDFLDFGDEARLDTPQSIHYIIRKAHNTVIDVRDNKFDIDEAQLEVHKANVACTRFMERITDNFLVRATNLDLLQVPQSEKPKRA